MRRARRSQEYQPLVKKEAAFVAVDRNASGSRPRELFEDAVEEAEAALEADRAALEAAVKARDVAVPPDGTLDAFRAALEGEEALAKLQPTSMCDPAGMFLGFWFKEGFFAEKGVHGARWPKQARLEGHPHAD